MEDDNDGDEYSLDDFTRLSLIQESKVDDDDAYTCFSEEQPKSANHGEEDVTFAECLPCNKVVCEEDDVTEGGQAPGGGGVAPFVRPCNDSEPHGGNQTNDLPTETIEQESSRSKCQGLLEEEETKASDTRRNSNRSADLTFEGPNVDCREMKRSTEGSALFHSTSIACDGDQEETKSSSDTTQEDVVLTMPGEQGAKKGGGGGDDAPLSQIDDRGEIGNLVSARLQLVEQELLKLAGTEQPGSLCSCRKKEGIKSNRQHGRGGDRSSHMVPKRQERSQMPRNPRVKVKREPGFVPSCAYAQKGSRRKSKKEDVEANQSKTKPLRYSRKRLEELSRPFRRFDDEKEDAKSNQQQLGCQKKTARQRVSAPSDGRGFLERMDFFEKERKDKLEQAAHQFHYQTSVKLRCRACGSYQTLEEKLADDLTCKSELCRGKGHMYSKPSKFILANFEARLRRSSMRKSLKIREIEEERISTLGPKMARSRKQLELQAKSSRNGGSFEERMQRDLQRRKDRLTKLSVGKEGLSEEYTFQPKLKIDESLLTKRVGGLERLATPSARYTEPYRPPPEEGRPMSSKRRRGRRRKPIESLWANDCLRKSFNGAR